LTGPAGESVRARRSHTMGVGGRARRIETRGGPVAGLQPATSPDGGSWPAPRLLGRSLGHRGPTHRGRSDRSAQRHPWLRRSDDTDARREARRCFGRADRSALHLIEPQAFPPLGPGKSCFWVMGQKTDPRVKGVARVLGLWREMKGNLVLKSARSRLARTRVGSPSSGSRPGQQGTASTPLS
jgi:hypothetical protein